MNKILEEDIEEVFHDDSICWEDFYGETILITGATGFLGSFLVRCLLACNKKYQSHIHMILLVRDVVYAKKLFSEPEEITYVESSLEVISDIQQDFSYVIHAAGPTTSKYFIANPVETIDAIVLGTKRLLEICKNKKLKKFLYFSSMEMYGVLDDKNVLETKLGYINHLDVRSSYSLGKRMAELYCYSYFKEYHVPIVIERLSMTFGSGLKKNENRVYKYFCDCVLKGQDILIKSSGKTVVNFIYVTDAVKATMILLNKGVVGEAYNVSSDQHDFTILDMANYLASLEDKKINVIRKMPSVNQGFAPDNTMELNNEKLKSLGWRPQYDIKMALKRTLEYLKHENKD